MGSRPTSPWQFGRLAASDQTNGCAAPESIDGGHDLGSLERSARLLADGEANRVHRLVGDRGGDGYAGGGRSNLRRRRNDVRFAIVHAIRAQGGPVYDFVTIARQPSASRRRAQKRGGGGARRFGRRGDTLSTTTSTYLSIENNLARYQKMVASEPAVKTATAYYAANIGSVTSVSGLVNNYRLLSYALTAYGLGDQVNNKALVTKVLEGGTTSSKALANTLSNPNWAKFAKAFSYLTSSTSATSATISAATSTTESNYVEQQLEAQEGKQDVGVQLALYFQRVAPTISSSYNVLGDENLLEAFQTIFGVTLNTYGSVDTNAAIVSKLMPMSDLTNPTKLKSLTERFTAQYTLLYGPGGQNASSPLTVTDSGTTTSSNLNAATSILSGVISGNSSYGGSSTAELFSSALLTGLQSLTLGG
jgi:hypothetical protein